MIDVKREWANRVFSECLLEANGDATAAIAAAGHILKTQPIPEEFVLSVNGHKKEEPKKLSAQDIVMSIANLPVQDLRTVQSSLGNHKPSELAIQLAAATIERIKGKRAEVQSQAMSLIEPAPQPPAPAPEIHVKPEIHVEQPAQMLLEQMKKILEEETMIDLTPIATAVSEQTDNVAASLERQEKQTDELIKHMGTLSSLMFEQGKSAALAIEKSGQQNQDTMRGLAEAMVKVLKEAVKPSEPQPIVVEVPVDKLARVLADAFSKALTKQTEQLAKRKPIAFRLEKDSNGNKRIVPERK